MVGQVEAYERIEKTLSLEWYLDGNSDLQAGSLRHLSDGFNMIHKGDLRIDTSFLALRSLKLDIGPGGGFKGGRRSPL